VFSTQNISSFAHDINPDGIIVGNDKDDRSELFPAHAWVRQTDGTVQNLPELKNDRGAAQGINRFGAIVGYSEASDGWPKAVLWRPQ
jgi:probable HAF family extracellular repeat protein